MPIFNAYRFPLNISALHLCCFFLSFLPQAFAVPYPRPVVVNHVINRHRAKQVATFEDYAEGRITRREYLSRKEEIARQYEEVTAIYTELIAKRAELQQALDNSGRADLGRYACANELTRELLVELVKEIRVSEEDTLEIMWNFRE